MMVARQNVPFVETSETVSDNYAGSFNATDGEGNYVAFEVSSKEEFMFCNQDMAKFRNFPPILFAVPANQPKGREWMNEEQQSAAKIFGVFSFCMMILLLSNVFILTWKHLQFFFWHPSITEPSWSSTTPFTSIEGNSGYIPSATVESEMYPVLFCDVSGLPHTLMSWYDPDEPQYRAYCTVYDIPDLDRQPCFSTVHYWPPPGGKTTDDIFDGLN
jgi:hypothetical protein